MVSSTKTWGGKWECEYVLIQSDGMKDIKFEVNKWFDPDSKVIHTIKDPITIDPTKSDEDAKEDDTPVDPNEATKVPVEVPQNAQCNVRYY